MEQKFPLAAGGFVLMVAQILQRAATNMAASKKEPPGFAGRLSNLKITFVRLFLMAGRGGFLRIRGCSFREHSVASDAAIDLAGRTHRLRAAGRHAAFAVDLPVPRGGGILANGCRRRISDRGRLRHGDGVQPKKRAGRQSDDKSFFHGRFLFLFVLRETNGLAEEAFPGR
jgi:hypothetical protein